jgi:hypothetical protein
MGKCFSQHAMGADVFGWLKGAKEQTVGDVMEAYGALIEKYPIAILDVSALPLPKAKMKALFKAMHSQQAKPEFQKYFEDGFMFLSQFQDGVGPVPIDGKLLDGDLKANLDTNIAILDKHALWQRLALAELDVLEEEWRRFKSGDA